MQKVNEFGFFFKNFSLNIKDKRKFRRDKDMLNQIRQNLMAPPSFLSQKEIPNTSLFDCKSPSLQRSLSEVEPKSELRPQRMFKPSLNRSFVEEERHKIQLEGTPMQIKVYRPEGCISHIFSSKVSKEQQESSPERLKIGLHSRNSEVKIETSIKASDCNSPTNDCFSNNSTRAKDTDESPLTKLIKIRRRELPRIQPIQDIRSKIQHRVVSPKVSRFKPLFDDSQHDRPFSAPKQKIIKDVQNKIFTKSHLCSKRKKLNLAYSSKPLKKTIAKMKACMRFV